MNVIERQYVVSLDFKFNFRTLLYSKVSFLYHNLPKYYAPIFWKIKYYSGSSKIYSSSSKIYSSSSKLIVVVVVVSL